MRADLYKPIQSSFLSLEKDREIILRKLFIENPEFGDTIKRLLLITTKDCLDNTNSEVYKSILKENGVKQLIDKGYIRTNHVLAREEFENVKAYIVISFTNFTLNEKNPEFRDCDITFDVICQTDISYLGNFRYREEKLLGCIDGLLNNSKLTGIGTLNFSGCSKLLLSAELNGYNLTYRAIHGSDDRIEASDE